MKKFVRDVLRNLYELLHCLNYLHPVKKMQEEFFREVSFQIIILFDNLQLYNVKLNDQLLFRLRIKKGKGILRRAKLLTSKTVWFIP